MFIPQLENTLDKEDKVNEAVREEMKAPNDLNQTSLSQTKKKKALKLLTNDIVVDEGKEYEQLWDPCSWAVTHKDRKLWCKYLYINFLLGLYPHLMDGCFAGSTFSEKVSSKEEPHSVPQAPADKLDVLPPPPDGAVIADEGETKNAEILKNNLAEDEKNEVMDSHDETVQTEGKNNISIALTDTVTSFFIVELVYWLPDHWCRIDNEVVFEVFFLNFNKLFIPPDREPDMEGILMGKKKGEENPAAEKIDEPLEYMAEEQGMEGLNVEKQQRKPPENIGILSIWRITVDTWNRGERIFNNHKFFSSDCVPQINTSAVFSDLEQELADYNGDDENEGEFEADKQAELAQI